MSFVRASFGATLFAVGTLAAGCGLMIDFDPPDPKPVDASVTDLGSFDAHVPPVDAGVPEVDGGRPEEDATVRVDAAAPECVGDAECNDGNPCTDDVCALPAGTCDNAPNAASCDDGSACTLGDFCALGVCTANEYLACLDDGNPCTVERCDAVLGCVTENVPDATSCDTDTNACTSAACYGGGCVHGMVLCPIVDVNPCAASACNPVTGVCDTVNLPLGTPCPLPLSTAEGTCDAAGVCSTARICAPGSVDCDGDRICECTVSGAGGGCLGPRCITASACVTPCGPGEICCPCDGTCISRLCTDCCASTC
jgi:hypothetical protein